MSKIKSMTKSARPIVFEEEKSWRRPEIKEAVVDGIFQSEKFRAFIKSTFDHAEVNVSSVSETAGFLKLFLRQNMGLDDAFMNVEFASYLAELAKFQADSIHAAEIYFKDKKPNPKAVKWPDPTGHIGEGSIYDTVPVVENYGIIDKSTPIGSAGSCFAVEIAKNLMERDFNYVVKEKSSDPETGRVTADVDPYNPVVQYSCAWGVLFNSPSFKQIAEKAFGERNLPPLLVKIGKGMYADPFRESAGFPSARSFERDSIKHINATREALLECEVFVITLGLNECWEYIPDGSVISRNPSSSELLTLLRHRTLTVQENVDSIQRFLDIVRVHNPKMKLILSVSPVPFIATGRADKYHVVTANGHSKAVLRVAAEQLAETNKDVFYFPSYEMVTMCTKEPWAEDQRHISQKGVANVMKLFDAMFVK
jgi:hypothetical protein